MFPRGLREAGRIPRKGTKKRSLSSTGNRQTDIEMDASQSRACVERDVWGLLVFQTEFSSDRDPVGAHEMTRGTLQEQGRTLERVEIPKPRTVSPQPPIYDRWVMSI